MGKNNEYIFIRYAAHPDMPDNLSHKYPIVSRLTRNRTRKFALSEYREAWEFLLECKAPITRLSSILWAFPRKEALDLLEALDKLKLEKPYEDVHFEFIPLRDCIGGDEIDDTIRNLNNEDKGYIELLNVRNKEKND